MVAALGHDRYLVLSVLNGQNEGIGTVMYNRARLIAIGGFDESLRRCEDYDLYLEVCPSSNVYIGRFEAFHEHPLYRWLPLDFTKLPNRFDLRKGQVKVCIGTDDPGIFPTTIENEHRVLKDAAVRFHQASGATAQGWIESIRDAGIAQFNRHRG